MKGSQTNLFHVGQRVVYRGGSLGHGYGTIIKLFRAGKAGAAEIKPVDGSKKVTRSLRYVIADTSADTPAGRRIGDDALRGLAMIERAVTAGANAPDEARCQASPPADGSQIESKKAG